MINKFHTHFFGVERTQRRVFDMFVPSHLNLLYLAKMSVVFVMPAFGFLNRGDYI